MLELHKLLLPCIYIYLALLNFILYNPIGIELVKLTVHLLNGDMYANEENKERKRSEILMWKYSTLLTITKGKKKEKVWEFFQLYNVKVDTLRCCVTVRFSD